MARPRGFRLSRPAFTDLLLAKHLTMSEVAMQSGLGLTTISNLVHDNSGASMRTVRQLAAGLGCAPATLFPELLGTAAETVTNGEAVA